MLLLALIQIFLGFLDLLGVILVGGLSALSIQGIESRNPGNKVSMLLRFLNLEHLSIHFQVAILGACAGLIFIVKTVASIYFTKKIFSFLSMKSAHLSSDLMSKILSQNQIQLNQNSSQEILYAVSSGVSSIMSGILATTINICADLALMSILIFGLVVVDPIVALSTLLIFFLIGFVLHRLLQVRAHELGSSINSLVIKNNVKILEVLDSYREIVVRNRQGFYSNEIRNLRIRLGTLTAEANFQPYIGKYVIESASMLGSLGLAGYEFATKNATYAIATLGLFLAASSRIAPAALRLQQGLLAIKSNTGGAEGTFELLNDLQDFETVANDESGPIFSHAGFSPDIKIANVKFQYLSSSKFSLNGLSFSVSPGSLTAIVGPSGAGKSTLVDLILGVLIPDSGSIEISGHAPREASRKWPGALSYVPQRVVVIPGTVRENIMLGYKASHEFEANVLSAVFLSQLQSVVNNLENGLDTLVGENGTRLSGGQRQRLGIARALFTKPKLLVLDEATSALDGKTEAEVSDAISKLSGENTVLVIAHRLSTIRSADQVIYLDKGEIKAIGTFDHVKNLVPAFAEDIRLSGL